MSMFNSKPDERTVLDEVRRGSSQSATTVIARGVKVEGEFTSQADVLVDGEVHGTFSTEGLLTVGSEAKIKADVKAGSAVISGALEGNMTVEKRVDVKATARITGDVTADTITVEAGAVIAGRMMIGKAVPADAVAGANNANRRERNRPATALPVEG
jgi:cytoskeletal protein CcmA (bactofilin family)